MTVVERSAYIVALEKKLYEAERALDGFRAIFNHFREVEGEIEETPTECYLVEPECVE